MRLYLTLLSFLAVAVTVLCAPPALAADAPSADAPPVAASPGPSASPAARAPAELLDAAAVRARKTLEAVTLNTPAGWRPVTTSFNGMPIRIWVGPVTSGFAENINLLGLPDGAGSLNLEQPMAAAVASQVPGGKVISESKVVLCGGAAARIVRLSATPGGRNSALAQMYAAFGNDLYIVTYAHALGQPELPEAIAAMESLCPRANAAPSSPAGSPAPMPAPTATP